MEKGFSSTAFERELVDPKPTAKALFEDPAFLWVSERVSGYNSGTLVLTLGFDSATWLDVTGMYSVLSYSPVNPYA